MKRKSNRFEALFTSSYDAIMSKDLNGIITSWNKSAEHIFGYTAEEMIGQPMVTLFPLAIVDEEQEILAAIRQGHSVNHFRSQRLHKLGHLVDVSVSISPIRDSQGKVVEASIIARDISAHVRHERELSFYKVMIDGSDDAILSENLDGTVLTWNAAAERIFGYASTEMVGNSIAVLFPHANLAEELALMARVRSGQPVRHYRTERVRKDGQSIFVSVSLSAILGANDEVVGFSKIARDITHEVAMENQVKHDACHDSLTGTFNRAGLYGVLDDFIHLAEMSDKRFATLYLDIDGFKPYNDTYGHEFGDLLLKEIADVMKRSVRSTDEIGRIGGDEFVVCLMAAGSKHDIEMAVRRLENSIRSICQINDVPVNVTASMGIAVFPDDGKTSGQLLKHADHAMYFAKHHGKNHHSYYSCTLDMESTQTPRPAHLAVVRR